MLIGGSVSQTRSCAVTLSGKDNAVVLNGNISFVKSVDTTSVVVIASRSVELSIVSMVRRKHRYCKKIREEKKLLIDILAIEFVKPKFQWKQNTGM